MPDTRPLGVLLDNIELVLEAKGLESTKDSGPFSLPEQIQPKTNKNKLGRTGAVPNIEDVSQHERRGENDERSLQRTTNTRLGR